MGGKSRKSGGVSKKLIEKIKAKGLNAPISKKPKKKCNNKKTPKNGQKDLFTTT